KTSQLNARRYIETVREVDQRGTPFPELSRDAWEARSRPERKIASPENASQSEKRLSSAKGWLLSWNPKRWPWETFAQDRIAATSGRTVKHSWSCGNGRAANGDRVFLVRTGEEPRGIIARGTAVSAPYEREHYDPDRAAAGEQRLAIDVKFDDIRDPMKDRFL